MSSRMVVLIVWMPLILLGCACGTKQVVAPVQVVPHVDLKRYLGTWYEIARFPHRFQEGCFGSRATYTLLESGQIGVLNECNKGAPDGPLSSVKGKARVVDQATNAKLKVSFFWPFSGDYWIIDLGENYEYAVVGHPTRKYLWVLGRTQELDEGTYRLILEKLERQGYDLTKLVKTPHKKG